MVTLHGYILRELTKTFLLTLAALTLLFTLGGGLYNFVRYEGITSADILRMMPMFVPIVLTITMPISALFAATMVYGRFAADNEFTACRAAGINVHRLFLAVILLSTVVTMYSVISANYIIPGLTKQLEYYVRSNLRNLAFGALSSKGYMRYARGGDSQVLLTADSVEAVSDKALIEKGFDAPNATRSYFLIANPRIMEVDGGGNLHRFASAKHALCQFDTDQKIRVTLHLSGAESYDMGQRAVKLGEQKIGPYEITLPLPLKPSMVDLNTLLIWRRDASQAQDIRKQIDSYLVKLRHVRFYEYARDRLITGEPMELSDIDGQTYSVRAGALGPSEGQRALLLRDVEITEKRRDMTIVYKAPQGHLAIRALDDGSSLCEVKLEEHGGRRVSESHVRPGHGDDVREKRDLFVDRLAVPHAVNERLEAITPQQVLDPRSTEADDVAIRDQRVSVQNTAKMLLRRVESTIHFRLGYGASPIFTVLIGATLGMMFRGSRALAAFGLSAIPFFSALIVMMMGRQLMENQGTAAIGPYVIWGSFAAFTIAAMALIRIGVRR